MPWFPESLDQQQQWQQHVGTCQEKHIISPRTPDLLNQTWGGGPAVYTRLQGDSGNYSGVRTTDTVCSSLKQGTGRCARMGREGAVLSRAVKSLVLKVTPAQRHKKDEGVGIQDI